MGNIIRKKKNGEMLDSERVGSPSPSDGAVDEIDALPPPLTFEEMMLAQIAVLESQWASDVERARASKERDWWDARGDVLIQEQDGLRHTISDNEQSERLALQQAKIEDAQNVRIAKGAAILWGESSQYRKLIEQEEAQEIRDLISAAFDEREEIMDIEVEHSAARVIQRNFRVSAARSAARRFIRNSQHAKSIQLWATAKLDMLRVKHMQLRILNQLEILVEERKLRAQFEVPEGEGWQQIEEAIESGKTFSLRKQWARTTEEKDAIDREEVLHDLLKAAQELATEEDNAFQDLAKLAAEEFKLAKAQEACRLQEERAAEARTALEKKHATEIVELVNESTEQRNAILREEDKAWWVFNTDADVSKVKAQKDFLQRVVTEQKEQRQSVCGEEETSRMVWVEEECNEWSILEKMGFKEFSKGNERQALREEIERLRIEQEYEYIRNLFIIMKEEEEWDAIEEEGYKERTDIQEREWKKLMDTQAFERLSVEEDEEAARIPTVNEEMVDRSSIYREFTRSFLKLPYQEFLMVQDVTYEPTLFVSPGAKRKTTSLAESQRTHGGEDKAFATCLRQGVQRWRLPDSPTKNGKPPPGHRGPDGKTTVGTLPPPRPPAKVSKSRQFAARKVQHQSLSGTIRLPRFSIPNPPPAGTSGIPVHRRNRTATNPDGTYRHRLVASIKAGDEGPLDPAATLPLSGEGHAAAGTSESSGSKCNRSWLLGGRLGTTL